MNMREKTNITLHQSVKKQAISMAKAEGRSLSEVIERLLEKEMARKKQQPPEQDAQGESGVSSSGSIPLYRQTRGNRGIALISEDPARAGRK